MQGQPSQQIHAKGITTAKGSSNKFWFCRERKKKKKKKKDSLLP